MGVVASTGRYVKFSETIHALMDVGKLIGLVSFGGCNIRSRPDWGGFRHFR